jgi:hypothetical protein
MYNLTVDEAHTFYVGDGDWLVHNCTAYANTANSALHQLPQNMRQTTVAMSMGEDGKPVLAVYSADRATTEAAVKHLRDGGWTVLDAPVGRGAAFHAEMQLFNKGYTNIGISRQAGMCPECQIFFGGNPHVTITPYNPPK